MKDFDVIVIGAGIALIIPIVGIPLAGLGVALLIWRGREVIIEEIRE